MQGQMRSCRDGVDCVGVDGSGTPRVEAEGVKTVNFLLPVHRHYVEAGCGPLVYHGGQALYLMGRPSRAMGAEEN